MHIDPFDRFSSRTLRGRRHIGQKIMGDLCARACVAKWSQLPPSSWSRRSTSASSKRRRKGDERAKRDAQSAKTDPSPSLRASRLALRPFVPSVAPFPNPSLFEWLASQTGLDGRTGVTLLSSTCRSVGFCERRLRIMRSV